MNYIERERGREREKEVRFCKGCIFRSNKKKGEREQDTFSRSLK